MYIYIYTYIYMYVYIYIYIYRRCTIGPATPGAEKQQSKIKHNPEP